MVNTLDWLETVGRDTRRWILERQEGGRPGMIRWGAEGDRVRPSERTGLAASSLALKTLVMLGGWDRMTAATRDAWVDRIRRFQVTRRSRFEGAFVDKAFIWRTLADSVLRRTRLCPPAVWRHVVELIRAESRQSKSALVEVGVETPNPPPGLLWSEDVGAFSQRLDWTRPWGAGAQFSSLLFFASHGLRDDPEAFERFQDKAATVLESVRDPETGSWHRGSPSPEQVINGAMKVLTGLAWTDIPIPEPERLTDYCLAHPPEEHGCSMTDRVYVLQRCGAVTDHRRDEVRADAEAFIEAARPFYHEGGGFRYFPKGSQTVYYGARITDGRKMPDVHGTCLFVWGLALATDILDVRENLGWRTMRP